jgi:hypothetical protein
VYIDAPDECLGEHPDDQKEAIEAYGVYSDYLQGELLHGGEDHTCEPASPLTDTEEETKHCTPHAECGIMTHCGATITYTPIPHSDLDSSEEKAELESPTPVHAEVETQITAVESEMKGSDHDESGTALSVIKEEDSKDEPLAVRDVVVYRHFVAGSHEHERTFGMMLKRFLTRIGVLDDTPFQFPVNYEEGSTMTEEEEVFSKNNPGHNWFFRTFSAVFQRQGVDFQASVVTSLVSYFQKVYTHMNLVTVYGDMVDDVLRDETIVKTLSQAIDGSGLTKLAGLRIDALMTQHPLYDRATKANPRVYMNTQAHVQNQVLLRAMMRKAMDQPTTETIRPCFQLEGPSETSSLQGTHSAHRGSPYRRRRPMRIMARSMSLRARRSFPVG